ncbi:MAG: hypothetical protein V3V57_00120 [Spirochaetia bacterium]
MGSRRVAISAAASGAVLLDFTENPVVGIFEFSALQRGGRIESPWHPPQDRRS